MSDTKDDAGEPVEIHIWSILKTMGAVLVFVAGLAFVIEPNVNPFGRIGIALVGLSVWLLGDALESAK